MAQVSCGEPGVLLVQLPRERYILVLERQHADSQVSNDLNCSFELLNSTHGKIDVEQLL